MSLEKLNVLLIIETNLDLSFPSIQLAIECFSSPFWLGRSSSGGGIMLFVREDIPSNLLSEYKPSSSVENVFIETDL